MREHISAALTTLVLVVLAHGPAAADVIYLDTFSGLAANGLNATAPGTRSGSDGGSSVATWSANNTFIKADGSILGAANFVGASAALPFTPQAGRIYSLSADVNTTFAQPSAFSDWISLGYKHDHTDVTSTFNAANDNYGVAWMHVRFTRGPGQGETLIAQADTIGAYDSPNGTVALKIVLDTTQPQWTSQWFANGVSVRGPVAFTVNPTIQYVGFGRFDSAIGTIDNFRLETVPEPSTALALGVSILAITRRRRLAARSTLGR